MSRVLVTGASGFLGTALVPRLAAAGHSVRVLVRRPLSLDGLSPSQVYLGDLRAPATLRPALKDVDVVVHLGAATSAGRMDTAEAYRVNVGGASTLVEACQATGCKRIIVASTQHVHLERPGVYGRTKRIADAVFADSGLGVIGLRPSLVYGPGQRGVFVKLLGLVRKLPIIPVIGPGLWRLRPVYLQDFLEVVAQAVVRPELSGRTYDVGGPEAVSYNQFLAAICAALGRPYRTVHLPIGVSFMIASVLERLLTNPPLTIENVHGANVEAPCDIGDLMRDFRVNLTPPLAAGLALTVKGSPS